MIKKVQQFQIISSGNNQFIKYNNLFTKVKGHYIEGQFAAFGRHIVIISDDILYEMGIHIYLFDKNLNILDYAEISGEYATDQFNLLSLDQPDTIKFEFLLDRYYWTIKVLPKRRLSFQIPRYPLMRKNKFMNHILFDIQKNAVNR